MASGQKGACKKYRVSATLGTVQLANDIHQNVIALVLETNFSHPEGDKASSCVGSWITRRNDMVVA